MALGPLRSHLVFHHDHGWNFLTIVMGSAPRMTFQKDLRGGKVDLLGRWREESV